MIAFPSSPTIGQEHTYADKTWEWTGSGWRKVVAAGGGTGLYVAKEIQYWDKVPVVWPIGFSFNEVEYV